MSARQAGLLLPCPPRACRVLADAVSLPVAPLARRGPPL